MSLKVNRLLPTVSVSAGFPTVPEALARLEKALEEARERGDRYLKVVHGWSRLGFGGGGEVHRAVRRNLQALLRLGRVRGFVAGDGTHEGEWPPEFRDGVEGLSPGETVVM